MKKKTIIGIIVVLVIVIGIFIFNKIDGNGVQNIDKQTIEEGVIPQQNFENIDEINDENSNENIDQNRIGQDENLDSFGDNDVETPWNLSE